MVQMSGEDKRTGDGGDGNTMSGVMSAIAKMREQMGVEVATTTNGDGNESNKRQKLDIPAKVAKPSVESSIPEVLPPRVTKPNVQNVNHANDVTPSVVLPPRTTRPNLPEQVSHIRPKDTRPVHDLTRPVVNQNSIRPIRETSIPSTSGSNFQTFNQIQVARSQTGNPLLEYLPFYQTNSKIKDVDYVINSKCIALFLSLKYHKLHPEYIYNKLKKITYNREDTLRVLLVYVDIADSQDVIRELNKIALFNKLSLIIAWTNEQCAMYLQNLKSVEKDASKKIIQGSRTKDDEVLANEGKYLERVVDVVSAVKSVSQTNAKSLLVKQGTVKDIIASTADDLTSIEGLGPLKVDRLLKAFNNPFLGGS